MLSRGGGLLRRSRGPAVLLSSPVVGALSPRSPVAHGKKAAGTRKQCVDTWRSQYEVSQVRTGACAVGVDPDGLRHHNSRHNDAQENRPVSAWSNDGALRTKGYHL